MSFLYFYSPLKSRGDLIHKGKLETSGDVAAVVQKQMNDSPCQKKLS
jgi:hypothetical protein